MTTPARNETIAWKHGEWRFGDRPQDVQAWLASPSVLHIMVDFRSPETPTASWHRIMTVTKSWLDAHAKDTPAGIWPALLIVPDGSRSSIETSITEHLDTGGWRLLSAYASLAAADYPDSEW
jgi:hypothetical protein